VEVGAFGVASINDTHGGGKFLGGEEKGYFTFGGSTIVLVFAPQTVRFSDDLCANSHQGLETLVKAGEEIARRW
jgi:phosphatidylserine decarboxylase